ncbi:STAS domain-containing protein [Actinomadura opuntiae]|uniref:STAS domain-containing protein n=1 Tax=Actinomadura sp. OS1-43 TaxID=604315 RepID=UPI00255AAF0F|nr:STAS domain-containing protein [Actinomadura sp. OS1-43]MDL4819599.1 STAS domain-containing protein [Actinomadura sp. OS1-43]
MPPLEVTARSHAGRAVVRLRGELDIAGSDELRRRLDAARREHGDHLILDLAELDFMDSQGLSVIVGCYKAATAAGGSLTLAGPRPIVRRTLEITGLNRRIPVQATLEAALSGGELAGGPNAARDIDRGDEPPDPPVARHGYARRLR